MRDCVRATPAAWESSGLPRHQLLKTGPRLAGCASGCAVRAGMFLSFVLLTGLAPDGIQRVSAGKRA